jgi:hypothetical protein
MSTAAAGAAPTMTEPAAKVPSSQTQLGAAILKIVLEVDTTIATGAATIGDGDGDELKVITGHPRLRALEDVSLSEAMGGSHFALGQAQEVLQ